MRQRALIQIRIVFGCILLCALVLVGRLYHIQIMNGALYEARAERQYVHSVDDLYTRGSIYFTTKDGEKVSAATIQAGFVLAMDPTRLTDPNNTYTQLSTVVSIDEETFFTKAARTESVYQVLVPRITNDVAEAIEALDLPGIQMYRTQWRFYPGAALAARTIGFVGQSADSGDVLAGRYGLERYYEDTLGRGSDERTVDFFAEIFSNLGDLVFDADETKKGSVVTSLEPTVTRMLEQVLEETQTSWGSTLTGGIVIDPQTGAIIAMSAVPNFDLNDRTGATIEDFRNPLVENVYEMGSIIKALTVAAGIDSGAITPSTTYYDPGRLTLDEYTISNYDGRGRGTVSMQEVLNQSLNTGVAFVVTSMGKEAFRRYFQALKLGKETGIDVPNETFGLVGNLESPRDIEYVTASYGQGIALTPVATVRALATLANGGVLVTPHLATAIEYEDGSTKDIVYPPGERVFTEATSLTISRMLTTVVDDALLGGMVALPNYSVAAKTGTAQIADTRNGGYYDDRYLHSFFGYFPSYEPRFLVLLYTVEPKNARYASETLTQPFIELTKFIINYYALPPDR